MTDELFPANYVNHPFPEYSAAVFQELSRGMGATLPPRVPGWSALGVDETLTAAYSELPRRPTDTPIELMCRMTRDLLGGAVNWRCPDLQYNLGAPVNVVAAVMYAVALDVNIYLINDGLAGNCVVAERAVSRILLRLAGVEPSAGLGVFTFGGTGTVAYAMKVGTRRARPCSGRSGLDGRIKVLVTEDAHFSHATAADWLGLGVDNLIVMKPDVERRSDLQLAAEQLERILRDGYDIGGIVLNGATTYDHTIDDITGFVKLRNDLVKRYQLQYAPHIHVDSVIGWVWLMFRSYDFERNELGIGQKALKLIEKQTRRVESIGLADSWAVDFHKGVGGCPVDCSFVLMNNKLDFQRLKKGGTPIANIHQLAEDFSSYSPVDYTFETSRAGGKALAALAALHSLGVDGYRSVLARVIEATVTLRAEIEKHADMAVLNEHALGYQTMVRLFPPDAIRDERKNLEVMSSDDQVRIFTVQVNQYLKEFFSWDNRTRMDVNAGGVVYSFSKKYVTTANGCDISGLKFYIVSPLTQPDHLVRAVETIRSRKDEFDSTIWRARGDRSSNQSTVDPV